MRYARTLALAAATGFASIASSAQAALFVGLTEGNQFVTFDSAAPNVLLGTSPTITGLQPGEAVWGIDYRPATGTLFGLGSSGRIYNFNPLTGAVISSVTLFADPADVVLPTFSALSGVAYGIDFNPDVDRLRVISTAGQNLRINVDTGATNADLPLQYAVGDPGAGSTPRASAAGYANNNVNPSPATVLYDIDVARDVLVTQTPPNNGTLNTVGALGFDTDDRADLDILFDGVTNAAFAAMAGTGDNTSTLFSVNLSTGAATAIGQIGGANSGIVLRDLTAVIPAGGIVPEPATAGLLALGAPALLLRRRRSA